VVEESPVTPIAPDRDGRLVRMVGTSLEGLREGAYRLVLDVTDEASGKRLMRAEPILLARGEDP
jgi:hypothetical protein